MALERPKSMDDLTYYSRRKIGDKGKAEVWVFRNKCSCGSIPKKPNMRAKEYVCNCGKITDLKDPELKHREGKPLIDTGHLRRSIIHVVEK